MKWLDLRGATLLRNGEAKELRKDPTVEPYARVRNAKRKIDLHRLSRQDSQERDA